MYGWVKLYRALLLLPNRGARESIADVKMLQVERGENLPDAQDPEHDRELQNSQDPFDVAENSEKTIPSHGHEDEIDPDDPFKDINLFTVRF